MKSHLLIWGLYISNSYWLINPVLQHLPYSIAFYIEDIRQSFLARFRQMLTAMLRLFSNEMAALGLWDPLTQSPTVMRREDGGGFMRVWSDEVAHRHFSPGHPTEGVSRRNSFVYNVCLPRGWWSGRGRGTPFARGRWCIYRPLPRTARSAMVLLPSPKPVLHPSCVHGLRNWSERKLKLFFPFGGARWN